MQPIMKSLSFPAAPLAAAAAVICFLSATVLPGAAAAIAEHTFIVSQMNMTHLCKETLVTVVNGQLPGPMIEVREGDSVAVHIVNKSPYNITIHWHGVKQRLNCWADGVPMITQYPIAPNNNYTYRFDVTGQEGTLWWHAYVTGLRGTLHGAFIIRPRNGTSSYPFPDPHREVPVVLGEYWEMDLAKMHVDIIDSFQPSASTINGKLGDLYNCSGVVEDGYVLDVEPGKTYLLRVINAALFSEYYLKIAGHKFTVVAADANYVRPYTTEVVAIAPGETIDALVIANAPPGRYYIVAQPSKIPPPDPQLVASYATRGTLRYKYDHSRGRDSGGSALSSSHGEEEGAASSAAPMAPEMPDPYDLMASFYFRGNLTSLHQACRPLVPVRVDEHLFIALALGTICRRGGQSCKRSGSNESIQVATLNNISFHLPAAVAAPLLGAQYYHHNMTGAGVELYTLPDRPPRVFNFTDPGMITWGPKEAPLEPTKRATVARRFQYGATVEVVFQSTSLLQSDSNPMHLHGHDVFVLAQGLGNYDPERDMARYNLVDPPVRNTVLVPMLGWVAVRFVADNPGVWYMHCHFEFHLSMGMTALFIVEDGPTVDTSLPPPPADFLPCDHDDSLVPQEVYLQTNESEGTRED